MFFTLNPKKRFVFLLIASALFMSACDDAKKKSALAPSTPTPTPTKPKYAGNEFSAAEFNAIISNKPMPYAKQVKTLPSGKNKVEKKVTSSAPKDSGDYVCKVDDYEMSAAFNENILLDPASTAFFPGALITGDAIEKGTYKSLAVGNVAKTTISISLENITGTVSTNIEPVLSKFREAKNAILNQKMAAGNTAAVVSSSMEEVYNKEQMNLAIGGGYDYDDGIATKANIESSFNFESSSEKSRFIVKYVQQYYSIDADPKANAAAFFKDISKVDAKSLKKMPLYVKSVKYGRIAYFAFTSSAQNTKMEGALKAAFSSGSHSGSINVDASQEKIINNSSITVTIIGGSGSGAAGAAVGGIDGIKKYISEGGNYSPSSPGLPVAYTLKSIYDDSTMKSFLATKYKVRNCVQATTRFNLTLKQLWAKHPTDAGSTAEIYGAIFVSDTKNKANTYGEFNRKGYYETVWYRGPGSPIEVKAKGGYISLNNISREYKFTMDEVKNNRKGIFVEFWLKDYDDVGSDDEVVKMIDKRYSLKDIITTPINNIAGTDGDVVGYGKEGKGEILISLKALPATGY